MRYLFVAVLIVSLLFKSFGSTIRVGCDFNYPPYSFVDEDGVKTGYDVELMKAIGAECGIGVEFDFDHWDSTLNKLESGQVDIIASIVYSVSREKRFDFTFPLHTEYYAIFANTDTQIVDVNDLKDLKGGLLEGDIAVESFFRPIGLVDNSIYASSLPEAISLLHEGLCDYVVAPYPLGMQVLADKGFDDIEAKGPPIIPSVYCLAVKQGDADLLSALNNAIQNLNRKGELDRIYKKWVKYKREDDKYHKFFYYSLIALAVLAFVIGLLLVFWYSLRKQVEKKTAEIKEAEEMYLRVFNAVGDALIIMNTNGTIVNLNKSALGLYGQSFDQMVGMPVRQFVSVENRPVFDEMLESIKNGISYDNELAKIQADGQELFLHIKAIAVTIHQQQRILAVMQDFTAEKKSITQLEYAKSEAESANKMKSTFLATISHEIRTPLFGVMGFSDLLSKTDLSDKQLEYLSKISRSSTILLNLVNDILDLTKIEARKLSLSLKPFVLDELIQKVYELELVKATKKSLRLDISLATDLPKQLVGDDLRISQILLNLLNNAVKFTQEGSVLLSVEKFEADDSQPNTVALKFCVKDSGIGIPADKLNHLFSPFEQLDSETNRKYGGSGLGLAISKQLADLMHGQITVDSEQGEGSCFCFIVSLQTYDGCGVNSNQDKHEFADDVLSLMSILLVEDNLFNAEILCEQLQRYGASVHHASSGKRAVEAVLGEKFDIILLDIEMPEMDGFETAKEIMKLPGKQSPIVALTAHADESERVKAKEAGFSDFLTKPAPAEELVDCILTNWERNRSQVFKLSVDVSAGMMYFSNNSEMYMKAQNRFLEVYQKTAPELLAIANVDNITLKQYTHNLKSGAKMIGAEKLSVLAEELDVALKHDLRSVPIKKVKALSKELEAVVGAIEPD